MADSGRLVRLAAEYYRGELECYRKMEQLLEQVNREISEGRFEVIGQILDRLSGLMHEIDHAEEALGPLQQELAALRQNPEAQESGELRELTGLVAELAGTLERLAKLEDRNRFILSKRLSEVHLELGQLQRGKSAARAYLLEPSANSVEPRFVDRRS